MGNLALAAAMLLLGALANRSPDTAIFLAAAAIIAAMPDGRPKKGDQP